MNKKIEFAEKQRGVTMIVLVITIIVLLILASATTNMVIGNNGVINKAKDYKTKQEIDALKLEIKTIQNIWNLDKESENTLTEKDLWNRMVKAGIIEKAEDVEGPVDEKEESKTYILHTKQGYKIEIKN